MKFSISLLFITTIFISCASLRPDNAIKVEDATVQLTGTQWFLISLNNQPIEIDALQPIKIKIGADNSFKGFGGCNQLWGICKLMNTQIKFTNINRTKMGCDKGETEKELLNVLQTAQGYFISKNKLHLINTQGEIIAIFQAA
jgi:heat shock protein HslJ